MQNDLSCAYFLSWEQAMLSSCHLFKALIFKYFLAGHNYVTNNRLTNITEVFIGVEYVNACLLNYAKT